MQLYKVTRCACLYVCECVCVCICVSVGSHGVVCDLMTDRRHARATHIWSEIDRENTGRQSPIGRKQRV